MLRVSKTGQFMGNRAIQCTRHSTPINIPDDAQVCGLFSHQAWETRAEVLAVTRSLSAGDVYVSIERQKWGYPPAKLLSRQEKWQLQ